MSRIIGNYCKAIIIWTKLSSENYKYVSLCKLCKRWFISVASYFHRVVTTQETGKTSCCSLHALHAVSLVSVVSFRVLFSRVTWLDKLSTPLSPCKSVFRFVGYACTHWTCCHKFILFYFSYYLGKMIFIYKLTGECITTLLHKPAMESCC